MKVASYCSMWLLLALCLTHSHKVRPSDAFDPVNNPSLFYEAGTLSVGAGIYPMGGTIPSARMFSTVVNTKRYVILYGGYATNGSVLGDLNIYDQVAQAWSSPIVRLECCNNHEEVVDLIGHQDAAILPNMVDGFQDAHPLPRAEHAACTILAYVTNSASTVAPVEDSFTEQARAEAGYTSAAEDPAITYEQREVMYVFGGNTAEFGYVNDLYQFDIFSLKYRHIVDAEGPNGIPRRRAGHSIAADSPNGVFYIFGGRTNGGNGETADQMVGLNDVWAYTAAENRWALLSQSSQAAPSNRQHAAMALVADKLVLFGGLDPRSQVASSDVWAFHLSSRLWEPLFQAAGLAGGLSPPPLWGVTMVVRQEEGVTKPGAEGRGAGPAEVPAATYGLLLYGGLGGGGKCGDSPGAGQTGLGCRPLETVLGQLYYFSLAERAWQAPHTVRGDLATAEEGSADLSRSGWVYGRVSMQTDGGDGSVAAETGDRGKMVKTFALEGVSFIAERNLLFEVGGVRPVRREKTSPPRLNATLQAPFLDSSGGALGRPYYDPSTGEALRVAVETPASSPWSFADAFSAAQQSYSPLFGRGSGSGGGSSAEPEMELTWLRTTRVYYVGRRDVVLLQEVTMPVGDP